MSGSDRQELGERFVIDLDFTTGLLEADRAKGQGPASEGIRAAVYRAASGVIRYSDDEAALARATGAIGDVVHEKTGVTVRRVVDALLKADLAPRPTLITAEAVTQAVARLASEEAEGAVEGLRARRP